MYATYLFWNEVFILKMKGGGGADFAAIAEKKKTVPHLSNLNLDPQLSGHIVHFLEAPEVCLGAEGDIVFKGPRYQYCIKRLIEVIKKKVK